MNKQKLTPIKFVEIGPRYRPMWLFRCECGNEVIRSLNSYRTNNVKSCGCLVTSPEPGVGRVLNLVGKKVHRLTAVERFRKRDKKGVSKVYYKCLCDCGNYSNVSGGNFNHGSTQSCGCVDSEMTIKRNQDPIFIAKRRSFKNKKYIAIHWKTNEEIHCTGSWEYGTVLYLNKNLIDFKWQIPFQLDKRKYICDLYLIGDNKYVEVKGRWLKDAKEKFDLFLSVYKDLSVEVWDRAKLFSLGIINNQGKLV